MSTVLPLYDPTAAADGWHDVRAPGGYEWWYFDAEDSATDTQVVVILLQGYIFHSGYLRHYDRWKKRPHRVQPPLPDDAICAYCSVYRGGKIWRQFLTQYPAMTASKAEPRVTIGPNVLEPDDDALRLHVEGTPWQVTGRGPQLLDETLAGTLTFTPTSGGGPLDRVFLSRAMTGAEHRWILANPRCEVRGTLGVAGETVTFAGRGYHDHNYGTAPIGPGLDRWIWGRIVDDRGTTTFHHATARDSRLPPEVHVLRADDDGQRELPADVSLDWRGRSMTRLPLPKRIEVAGLTLGDPVIVDDAPFYLRATYRTDTGGQAFCEIAHPHRLRWPVLGRMVEMSLDKRPMKQD